MTHWLALESKIPCPLKFWMTNPRTTQFEDWMINPCVPGAVAVPLSTVPGAGMGVAPAGANPAVAPPPVTNRRASIHTGDVMAGSGDWRLMVCNPADASMTIRLGEGLKLAETIASRSEPGPESAGVLTI